MVIQALTHYYYVGPQRAGILTFSEIYDEVARAPHLSHQLWRSPWEIWRSWDEIPSLRELVGNPNYTVREVAQVQRRGAEQLPEHEQVVLPLTKKTSKKPRLAVPHSAWVLESKDELFWRIIPPSVGISTFQTKLGLASRWTERAGRLKNKARHWTGSNGKLDQLEDGSVQFTFEALGGALNCLSKSAHRLQFSLSSSASFQMILSLTGFPSSRKRLIEKDEQSTHGYRPIDGDFTWPELPGETDIKVTFDLKRRHLMAQWDGGGVCTSFHMIGDPSPRLSFQAAPETILTMSPILLGEQPAKREADWPIPNSVEEVLAMNEAWLDGPLEEAPMGGYFMTVNSSASVSKGVIVSAYQGWPEASFLPIYGPTYPHQPVYPSPSQLTYLGPEWRNEWVSWADELAEITSPPNVFCYTAPHTDPEHILGRIESNQVSARQQAYEVYCKYQHGAERYRTELLNGFDRNRWELLAAAGDPYANFLHGKHLEHLGEREAALPHYENALRGGCALSAVCLDHAANWGEFLTPETLRRVNALGI